MTQPKEVTMWAVYSPDNKVMLFSINDKRKYAIKDIERLEYNTWKNLYAQGYRLHKIRITPIVNDKK